MNRAHEGAKRKGYKARMAGIARSECPYEDHRTPWHGHVTFSRSFITVWHEGWDEADKEMSK